MSPLAIVVAYLAILVIALRGPLIVAPEATVAFYKKWFFQTSQRVRRVGVGMLVVMAVPLMLAARTAAPEHARIANMIGMMALVAGSAIIVFPKPLMQLTEGIISNASAPALRIVGVVSVAVALLLIRVTFTL